MKRIILIPILVTCFNLSSYASDYNIPNVFIANQPAIASEVNGNFGAAKTAIDNNNSRIVSLEATIVSLQNTVNSLNSRLIAVEDNTVLELDGLLQYSLYKGYPTAEFTSVNLQVNSGIGTTDGLVNGLGNIIIGYNENAVVPRAFCSNGQYTDSVNCIGNGFLWGANVFRGSHNLVMGKGNSYDDFSSVINGFKNIANGNYASILTGTNNLVSGFYATVTGGFENKATGEGSSVSGGAFNQATGQYSSVTGGRAGIANGQHSSISGGDSNTALGTSSVVSGGRLRTVNGVFDWRAGTLFETQ